MRALHHQAKKLINEIKNLSSSTGCARSFLPGEADLPRFINADLIAAGLAPFAPETAAIKAGRLMRAKLHNVQHAARALPSRRRYRV